MFLNIMHAYFTALQHIFTLPYLLAMSVGCVWGLIVGVLPGLGGLSAMAITLAFIFKLKPEVGLPVLIALHSVTLLGGSITAILLNIPGEAKNAATLLDGYPMTQKGEATRALGVSISASTLGAIVSTVFALFMIPIMIPVVMSFGSPEMVFIVLAGLLFVGVLGRESMLRGLMSGLFGMLLAFVGFQNSTGVPRFTFDSLYLYDGLPLVPLALGLFSIPELLEQSAGGSIAAADVKLQGFKEAWKGCMDVFRHWGVFLRATVLGYIVGIIPAIGGLTAVFVAYAQAKSASNYPEKFGTGVPEGIIAPEAAGSASTAGDLLTTMALGIPGSAGMAILIGAYLMMGLIPGPEMMTKRLDLSLLLLLTVAIASILAAVICFLLSPYMAAIAKVPSRVMVPIIGILIIFGAYATDERIMDVFTLLVFGVVGVFASKFNYVRPAIMLGYILGGLFEKFAFLSYNRYGVFFFMRPVSLIIIAVMVAYFIGPRIMKQFKRVRNNGEAGDAV